MAQILAVGVATLDIVNEVETWPAEDTEVRALAQTVRRGGNATNTLVVLSQLGHRCEWAGVMVDAPAATVIQADLEQHRIGTAYCRHVARGTVPTSYITLSRATGSRSIVHYRDLPEFDFTSFAEIPLETFDWVHFEGRDVRETLAMMRSVREKHPQCPLSVEIEKPRPGIDALLPWADLIVTTAMVAEHRGCSPEALLKDLQTHSPAADVVCTLGNQGAIALDGGGTLVRRPAFPPPQLVDSVGAGDTFNAAMIDSRLRGNGLSESLRFACALAGKKCARRGLDGFSVSDRGMDE